VNGLFALIPVKDPARGKSRLAPLLDERARHELNLSLARRTIAVCASLFGPARTVVITAAPAIQSLARAAATWLVEESHAPAGLNAALAAGAADALQAGARAVLVVPTDLPLLSEDALRLAVEALPPAPGCLLVPDRHLSGTNLLGLAPAHADLFSFGEDSFARHAALARRLGCALRVHTDAALALDLDLPEDYRIFTGETTAWPTSGSTTPTASARRSDSTPM
jgi:2-phospho-L-lactate/phosphoenolpyruvate guanylyltransferase